jgi:hypothetical protein
MISPDGRENAAAFLPGMDETVLADMQDYDQHRLALDDLIRAAMEPIDNQAVYRDRLDMQVRSTAGRFGQAFLALYEFREGDLRQTRGLTARLWMLDDTQRAATINHVVGYEAQWPREPRFYMGMVQNGTESRRPDRYIWAEQLSRRYQARTLDSLKRIDMHLEWEKARRQTPAQPAESPGGEFENVYRKARSDKAQAEMDAIKAAGRFIVNIFRLGR